MRQLRPLEESEANMLKCATMKIDLLMSFIRKYSIFDADFIEQVLVYASSIAEQELRGCTEIDGRDRGLPELE